MRKVLVLFLLLTNLSLLVNGQTHEMLASFTAIQTNNVVQLDWTIKKGNTCFNIIIHRAVNDTAYTEIGSIAGVCGNTEQETFYSFTDSIPVNNQLHLYKLELGFYGYSSPARLFYFQFIEDNYTLIRHGNTLMISTHGASDQTLYLYDLYGKLLNTYTLRNRLFELNGILPGYNYIFRIENDKNGRSIANGKFWY